MANSTPRRLITARDRQILGALERSPLTVEQLLTLSQTFEKPFRTPQRLRGRLGALREAGWLKRWRYATTCRGGAPDYHKLTLMGFRILHGSETHISVG